ncbi:MAG: CehA/McbA family metallohydrolase [Cetobacterium sp.]|uniref:CehA/McbA family metallohydrolase n=1 Tax=Cetobacterium sp. TaxID=2071632 RepID=UPI003F3AC5BF
MILNGVFTEKECEVLTFNLNFRNIKTNIILFLKSCPDEHFPVTLKDPNGNIRILTTFKAKEKIFYSGKSFECSSNCSLPGELIDGIWKLEVTKPYAFKGMFVLEILKDVDMNNYSDFMDISKFDYEKEFSKEKKWYKGELHAHTKFSDGLLELKNLPKGIDELNLDFIFLTDHNVVSTKTPLTSAPIIPSTELTLMENGHFNFLGLKNLPDYANFLKGKKVNPELLKTIFEWVKKQNALLVMNHPLNATMGVDYNLDLNDFDLIEVLNSPYNNQKTQFNIDALKAFDGLLMNGHKIFAVGGSDSHSDFIDRDSSFLGKPLNYVHMNGFTVNNLLQSLKVGKSYISTIGEVDFSFNEIDDKNKKKEIFFGENSNDNLIECNVSAKEKISWKIIINGEIKFEIKSDKFNLEINLPENGYFRIEGYINNDIAVLTNPIFFGVIPKTNKKWLDIRK